MERNTMESQRVRESKSQMGRGMTLINEVSGDSYE